MNTIEDFYDWVLTSVFPLLSCIVCMANLTFAMGHSIKFAFIGIGFGILSIAFSLMKR